MKQYIINGTKLFLQYNTLIVSDFIILDLFVNCLIVPRIEQSV